MKITWHNGEVPKGMPVTQVYGLIFTRDGRMLMRIENKKGKRVYTLAGGTPEKYDSDRVATLRRELIEEVNTEIEDEVVMVGYQEIDEENGRPVYAQVRMTAIIKRIGEQKPDPDTGETYDRFLTTPQKAIDLLNWGEVGEKQITRATELAKEKLGIKEFRDFDEEVDVKKEIMEEKELLKLSSRELTDMGICPTCLDRKYNGAIFGDSTNLRLYEDDDIDCMFVGNPRAKGHLMIASKTHYHDMSEAPDELNAKIIRYAKRLMQILCEVYGCERVYLCTMSDGPMNHYHVQLIPRYNFEERGSKNFVKPRGEYIYEEETVLKIRALLSDFSKTEK